MIKLKHFRNHNNKVNCLLLKLNCVLMHGYFPNLQDNYFASCKKIAPGPRVILLLCLG